MSTMLLGVVLGAAIALLAARLLLRRPSPRSVRTNIKGRPVPAVLGLAFVAGGVAGLVAPAWSAATETDDAALRVAAAVLIVVLILAGAGFWDDLRGDERPRGFKGHLGALGDGRMTGGIVKMVAGGLAGMAAGVLVADTLVELVQVAGMVALSANLINLFDRAPGRAGKVGILFGAVGAGIAQGPVLPMAAPFLGASLAVLPLDLKEEAMLGDQGANPLGGLGGLVWALAVGEEARWLALAVLLFLNLASERWSFSQVIESAPALRRIDGWGRQDD